jgi:RNA polymerase sigma-70 factor, ECF subfamily
MTADAVMTDTGDGALPIVRAAKEGDTAAFDEIMRTTERRVAQVAWAILGDIEDVKDAMQETYLRAFRHFRRYDESRNLTAWLVSIAVNVCRDTLKRRRPVLEVVDSAHQPRIDERLMLRRAIDSLPEGERTAIILHDVEGFTAEEAASAIGNTAATVRVQLSRARAKLRELLGGTR